jgi:hypothetical protein
MVIVTEKKAFKHEAHVDQTKAKASFSLSIKRV